MSALDCPESLGVWIRFKHGEHKQLAELECNPRNYNDMLKFRDAYAAVSYLSKAKFLETGIDIKAAGMEKFLKYEELCKRTNERFSNLSFDTNFSGANVWLLDATRRKIAKILGFFDADEMLTLGGWGPGSSTIVNGTDCSATNKFRCDSGITRDCYQLLGPLMGAYPIWQEQLLLSGFPTFQAGNAVTNVPKNAKVDRIIAIEPGVNLWFQKAIGSMLRSRLSRVGVDLNQQTRNQQLAKSASKTGFLATVDFSSASDSIAIAVVRELLPPRWFAVMDAARSQFGSYNDKPVHWQKFSSMGNGFTFELESLIFFAAATCCEEMQGFNSSSVSVYGDDVIIPTDSYNTFASFCDFLGFKVNQDKTFYSGPFRESCGSHYWGGIDVKPVFLKDRLNNVHSIFKAANRVRCLAHNRNMQFGCDADLRPTWLLLYRLLPKDLRIGVEFSLGDTGFISNQDEVCAPCARNHKDFRGNEGFLVAHVKWTAVKTVSVDQPLLISRLWQMGIDVSPGKGSDAVPVSIDLEDQGNFDPLRGRTTIGLGRSLVQRWYNLGPWM